MGTDMQQWQGPGPWEQLLYYMVVGAAFLRFVVRGIEVSNSTAPLLSDVHGDPARVGLGPGWLLDRRVDLSDIQWRVFREGLPLSTLAFAAFVLLSRQVRWLCPKQHKAFYIVSGIAFSAYLHQACILFVLVLLLVNYCMARSCAGQCFGPVLIWTANCSVLLIVRWSDGISFGFLSPQLAFLDHYRGPLRWHISYNLLMLRMISFAMDWHWALLEKGGAHPSTAVAAKIRSAAMQGKQWPQCGLEAYSLTTYVAYALYPPLYIAGPTMTFNSFASQMQHSRTLATRQVWHYGLRLLASLLLLEVFTHFLHFNVIAKTGLWRRSDVFGAADIGMTGFWVLAFMWLKFLVIWRFFRFWALADGIEPPENMLRCFCNNYDIEGFWKSWHASYNAWLVRYLYIPLGGSDTRLANIWVVFTFVALWHDLEWHLLGWAWLMCLFFVPELSIKWAARQPCSAHWQQLWWYRHMCAAAAAVNITALMAVNLVGFVLGLDGVVPFAQQLVSQPGFVAAMFVVFFSATQLMFQWRRIKDPDGDQPSTLRASDQRTDA